MEQFKNHFIGYLDISFFRNTFIIEDELKAVVCSEEIPRL